MAAQAWNLRRFALFWLAHTWGLFGDVLFSAAMMWFVYRRTGSALATTGVPLAEVLARVAVGMVAGSLADRRPRARWMAEIQGLKIALVALVAVGWWQRWLLPWMTYAFTLAFTGLNALYEPAYTALLPHLVPSSRLTQANAVAHISRTLAYGLSWLLSGYLLARLSETQVALANATVLMLSMVGFMGLHIQAPVLPRASAPFTPLQVWKDLRLGARWLAGHAWLRALVWVSLPGWLTLGLWGPLQLVFLTREFGAGPESWGWMQAAFFLSGLLGALLASAVPGWLPLGEGPWILAVALLHGGLTVLYGLAPGLGWVLASVALAGLTDPFFLAAREALLQYVTPDALRGRVAAVWNILTAAGMAGSYLLLGLLAEQVPLRSLYVTAGVVMTLWYALVALLTPLGRARVLPRKP